MKIPVNPQKIWTTRIWPHLWTHALVIQTGLCTPVFCWKNSFWDTMERVKKWWKSGSTPKCFAHFVMYPIYFSIFKHAVKCRLSHVTFKSQTKSNTPFCPVPQNNNLQYQCYRNSKNLLKYHSSSRSRVSFNFASCTFPQPACPAPITLVFFYVISI